MDSNYKLIGSNYKLIGSNYKLIGSNYKLIYLINVFLLIFLYV